MIASSDTAILGRDLLMQFRGLHSSHIDPNEAA